MVLVEGRAALGVKRATDGCKQPAGGAPGNPALHVSPSFALPRGWAINRELVGGFPFMVRTTKESEKRKEPGASWSQGDQAYKASAAAAR